MLKRLRIKIVLFAVVCFIAGSLLGTEGLAKGYAGEVASGTVSDSGMLTEVQADPMEAFVTRMYQVILEREPDAGSSTWINGLKDGSFTGVRVADGFVLSEEMLNKDISNEEFVKILYRAFFGREADEGGLATWKGLLDAGCKKQYVFAGFANSTEFGKLCAEAGIVQGRAAEYLADRQTGLSEQDYKVWCFVERMYTEVLKRTADESGVRTWVGVLQDGSYTGVKVADGFLMSEEFLAKDMTNEEYVQIMYRAFFGRNADSEGLATWTNALETGWTKQRVFAGFANSNEFGVLCEQAGIVKGTAEVAAAAPEKPYKIVNEVEGVRLFWNPVEDGTLYGVWRREEGVENDYAWLANVAQTDFVDTTAESGKSYTYRITSYDTEKQSHSSASDIVGILYLAAPEITACYNDAEGITLEWTKVEGATEYEIQRWNDFAKYWERVYTIRDADTLKWTDENSIYENGKVFKYTVSAGNGSEKNDSGIREEGTEMIRLRGEFDSVFIPRLNSDFYSLYFGNYTDGKWIEADGYQLRILQNSVEHKIEDIRPYKENTNSSHSDHMSATVYNKVFQSLDASKGKISIQLRYYKEIENMGTVYSSWGDEVEVVSHKALEVQLNEIVTMITESAETDLEKAIAVYDWVVDNVRYKYGVGLEDQYIENAIINGYAVCGGYANTFLVLAERVGLEAICVRGYPEDPTEDGHAWNQVEIDGQWYNLDATWGDSEGILTSDKDLKFYAVIYSQFLLSDTVFNRSHKKYSERSKEYECPETYDVFQYVTQGDGKDTFGYASDCEELQNVLEEKLQGECNFLEIWGWNVDQAISLSEIEEVLKIKSEELGESVVVLEKKNVGLWWQVQMIFLDYSDDGATVMIPDGVTVIHRDTFQGRSDIVGIEIPDSVALIDEEAFYGCSGLRKIEIPEGIKFIDRSTFYGCSSLESIVIPKGVYEICSGAFEGCRSLEFIDIPNSVTMIGSYAFSGCSNLKYIDIPDGVTDIVANTFELCESLEFIDIPSSVTTIGREAFYYCSSLRQIEIPKGVTQIEVSTFENCKSLEKITIPDSVTTIGGYAFSCCNNLDQIEIPDGVAEINAYTFYNCWSLESVTIPKSVTTIGQSAFEWCADLKDIVIPRGVREIEKKAFYGCSELTDVELPDSLTFIGENAFSRCKNLTIHCKAGSYAETYAIENGIAYVTE